MRGSIQVRELKKKPGAKHAEKRFDAVWRAGGKQCRKTFETRREAGKHLAKMVVKVSDGTFQNVRGARMRDVFKAYLKGLKKRVEKGIVKPSTARTYASMVETHLAPSLGHVLSNKVGRGDIARWEEGLLGNVSNKTFRNVAILLGVIFKWARDAGFLSHDPMRKFELPALDDAEAAVLERDDMAALLRAAAARDTEVAAVVHLSLFAGLRRGETFALKWQDIDWGDGISGGVHVRNSWSAGELLKPKTKNSRRVVDLPGRVLDVLAAHRQAAPGDDGDFIFRSAAGTPVDLDNWYRRKFRPLCFDGREEVILATRDGLRNAHVGLHVCRHTFASLLLSLGQPLPYVSRMLGHASIKITVDTYGHLLETTRMEAVERLNAVIPEVAAEPKLRAVK